MDKKQSIIQKLNNPFYFLTIALIIIVVTFALFSPRVSSALFPFKRDAVFNQFIEQTKKVSSIDPQKFWEFREFYSPGYFEFSEKGVGKESREKALGKLEALPKAVDLYFSIFRSKHLISIEGLTKEASLDEVLNKDKSDIQSVLFEDSRSIIYKNAGGETYIIFTLPISEMRKANGFFEYDGKDKELVKDKNWFTITKLDR